MGTTETTQERDAARAAYKRVCDERDYLRAAQGVLYRERAHLTAFLAACYPSAQCPDRDDDEYRLLYVTTPDGQLSWHVHTDDADELLGHVPHDEAAEWDGHTTEEKYRRLEALVCTLAYLGPPAQVDAGAAERERDEARAELAKLREGARELGHITARLYRVMEAARIESHQGNNYNAVQWILNSLPPPVDEGDGLGWDGQESAQHWFDRAEADRAAEAEAGQ
jgi:hypothetical protein